jgi:hypothetical protein
MPSKHLLFVAAACALSLSLAACGGASSDSDPPPPIPEGAHYGYVVSGVSVPTTEKERSQFGLDLGSGKSKALDGIVDNKLGGLTELLSAGVDIKSAVDKAVNTGSILLLVDFQTKDLANSTAAGFGVKIGDTATATPAPCTDPSDTVCGHHLDGHGMFTVAAGSPTDAVVGGKIVGGAFTGGPGDVTLQLSLGGGTPLTLNLLRARIQATISPTGIMNATIGGLLTQSEIMAELIPLIQTQVNTLLGQSCTPVQGQPCNCTGAAARLIIAADTNFDCQLTTDEILAFPAVSGALAPDVCTTSSCTKPDGVSVGVQVQAVKAAFPGEM